jgi:Spy/CpxP family protein refolding chaperone
MSTKAIVGLIIALSVALPVGAADTEGPAPASHETLGRAFDDLMEQMHSLGERFRRQLTPAESPLERPLISIMLDHRRELELTPAQVKELERLRTGFQREAIKLEADQRVAQLDLTTLLGAEPLELDKAEAKIREIERLRADVRIARIRAIERARAQLTAQQREKLLSLLGELRPATGGGGPVPSSEAPRRL